MRCLEPRELIGKTIQHAEPVCYNHYSHGIRPDDDIERDSEAVARSAAACDGPNAIKLTFTDGTEVFLCASYDDSHVHIRTYGNQEDENA